MSDIVLDSAAVLAVLLNEPGAGVVLASIGDNTLISTVNLIEVITRLVDTGSTEEWIAEALGGLGLEVIDHTESQAWQAGMLRAATKQYGLSLGDRVCLVLASERGLPVLTADRQWANVDVGVEVRLCR